ncbi:hypothetical protein Godav_009231 [Gossypium davidsonii]|uniref:Uncharacterized protein n=1 Tax=Gossypium davidsonii TaxID=34287 RepID=A0A7J8SD55_GOSDV|nr:hypothetical protein [Gossypium davidsonii]
MGNLELRNKPHAICIPFLAQGHINPMLKLAKLLQHNGFHITFVNHKRLLKSRRLCALNPHPSFRMNPLLENIDFLEALRAYFRLVHHNDCKQLGSNLWKEDPICLEWLDSKQPNSVVYVNFGVISVMTPDQLTEFACGLANSNHSFCGLFGLIYGWNSTIESISFGVPMIWWPFAEQQTNCWFSCTRWGIAMEINSDVKRDEVAGHWDEKVGEDRWRRTPPFVKDSKDRTVRGYVVPGVQKMLPWELAKSSQNNMETPLRLMMNHTVDDSIVPAGFVDYREPAFPFSTFLYQIWLPQLFA